MYSSNQRQPLKADFATGILTDDAVWRPIWLRRYSTLWSSPAVQAAARRWHCHHFNPRTDTPPQGWKALYFQFEQSWIGWAAAGCNTEALCVLGIGGQLYDLSPFVAQHPGSPDTLLDNAGKDATRVRVSRARANLAHTARCTHNLKGSLRRPSSSIALC